MVCPRKEVILFNSLVVMLKADHHSVVEDKSKILGYTKPVHFGDRFESLWGKSLKGIGSLVNINEDKSIYFLA